MFKNREVRIRLAKTQENEMDDQTTNVIPVDPETIAKIATDYTVKTIGAIGIVIAGHKVLSTICDIAVVAAKAKFK